MSGFRFSLKKLPEKTKTSAKLKSLFRLKPITVKKGKIVPSEITIIPYSCIDVIARNEYSYYDFDTYIFSKDLYAAVQIEDADDGPGVLVTPEHIYQLHFTNDRLVKLRRDDPGIEEAAYEPIGVSWFGYSWTKNTAHIFGIINVSGINYLVKLDRDDLTEIKRQELDIDFASWSFNIIHADEYYLYLLVEQDDDTLAIARYTLDLAFVDSTDLGLEVSRFHSSLSGNTTHLFWYQQTTLDKQNYLYKIRKDGMSLESLVLLGDTGIDFFEANCQTATEEFIFMFGYAYTNRDLGFWDCAIARLSTADLSLEQFEITYSIPDIREMDHCLHSLNLIQDNRLYVILEAFVGDVASSRLILCYTDDDGETWNYKPFDNGYGHSIQEGLFIGDRLCVVTTLWQNAVNNVFFGYTEGCHPIGLERTVIGSLSHGRLLQFANGELHLSYGLPSPNRWCDQQSDDGGKTWHSAGCSGPMYASGFEVAFDDRYNDYAVLFIDPVTYNHVINSLNGAIDRTELTNLAGYGYTLFDYSGDLGAGTAKMLIASQDGADDIYIMVGNGHNMDEEPLTKIADNQYLMFVRVSRKNPNVMWMLRQDTADPYPTYLGKSTDSGSTWNWTYIADCWWTSDFFEDQEGNIYFFVDAPEGAVRKFGLYSSKWGRIKYIPFLEGEGDIWYERSVFKREAG
ncbi:MAG: hypothetical protein AB1423_14425 [Pseudomonadota bacterium]